MVRWVRLLSTRIWPHTKQNAFTYSLPFLLTTILLGRQVSYFLSNKKIHSQKKKQTIFKLSCYQIQAGNILIEEPLKFITGLEKQIRFMMFFYCSHKKMLYII